MYRQAAERTKERLDRESPVPLYYQLKEIFRSWIISGKFDFEGRFPSESELQRRFRVSRMTIRRALSELVQEGFLVREQGRGSFVVRPRLQEQIGALVSFTEAATLQTLPAKSKILDFQVVVDEEIAKKMGVPGDERLVRLQRLRFIKGEPVALQSAYVRHRLCPDLVQHGLKDGSLYKTLEEDYGLSLGEAVEVLEAASAVGYEAKLLKIEVGSPVLILEQLTYLQNGAPVEYTRSVYRGDRYRFTAKLVRSNRATEAYRPGIFEIGK